MDSSDSLAIYNHILSLIQAYLSNQGVTDFTNFAFELASDRKPNFISWHYIDIAEPSWETLESLENTPEHISQKPSVTDYKDINVHSILSKYQSQIATLDKQIADLTLSITKLKSEYYANLAELQSKQSSDKTLATLKEVQTSLSKVETEKTTSSKSHTIPKPSILTRKLPQNALTK